MIAYLKGEVIAKSGNYFILETNGVGYQIYSGENFLADLHKGASLEVYIHHHVREDQNDLYGFRSLDELELFELLISVSGVGPKSALAVISLASAHDIKEAIIRGDAALLTKVSGIGKKTAERLVLELKSKVARTLNGEILSGGGLSSVSSDEIDALMSLGYSLPEAREALNAIDPSINTSSARVKAALKRLAK